MKVLHHISILKNIYKQIIYNLILLSLINANKYNLQSIVEWNGYITYNILLELFGTKSSGLKWFEPIQ